MSDTNLYKTLKRYQLHSGKANAQIAKELGEPNIVFYFSRWEKRGIKGIYRSLIKGYLERQGFIKG